MPPPSSSSAARPAGRIAPGEKVSDPPGLKRKSLSAVAMVWSPGPMRASMMHCVLGSGLVPLARFACERRRNDGRGKPNSPSNVIPCRPAAQRAVGRRHGTHAPRWQALDQRPRDRSAGASRTSPVGRLNRLSSSRVGEPVLGCPPSPRLRVSGSAREGVDGNLAHRRDISQRVRRFGFDGEEEALLRAR